VRHGSYNRVPSHPFRSATIDHIQHGKLDGARLNDEFPGANLGLYSVTFVNRLEEDLATLRAFKEFREEAECKKFRYFLEVFDPNVDSGVSHEKVGEFINDHIIRALAGVTESARPLFLKIVYHGPRLMEELARYDPKLVVGILGGGAGTTYDAFKLIHEAQKYGARVALFGRKINHAEHQLAFIQMLRLIVEGRISPEEAVRAYHGVLQGKSIKPRRSLEDDMQLTDQAMSYAGTVSRATVTVPEIPKTEKAPTRACGCATEKCGSAEKNSPTPTSAATSARWPVKSDGSPDFGAMTAEQRAAYHESRLAEKFG
jgi:hypothetical protein